MTQLAMSRGEGILPSHPRPEPQARGQDALATSGRQPRIVVVGGGLAGMAGAGALGDAGGGGTPLEARKRLGGRRRAFGDPPTRQQPGKLLHAVLWRWTELLAFFRSV